MLHTVTGSEEILSKQYAAGGQEIFICPLSKYMIYTWYKRWRENSTQVNKSEIALEKCTMVIGSGLERPDFLMSS